MTDLGLLEAVWTSLPHFGSDQVSSFDLLHPAVQRWIWEQNWQELRDVQDRAITTVLKTESDVLIAAATAAGKTEAAFLPILTAVAERDEPGFSVVYISPLKALINDQFRRLDFLCERMEIDVVRWHGDAPQAAKQRARRNPKGIALITPESIEAMLVRRPADARRLLGNIAFIVIDELHAFLRGPRGLHLMSLLRRIDQMNTRHPRRIGLSATIGDLRQAAEWLAPGAGDQVSIIESHGGSPEFRLQVRGYVDPPKVDGRPDDGPTAIDDIVSHLFTTLRGSSNLVFAGSRKRVETLADRLRERSERIGVPNEFFPHHGSLAKGLREELETRLRDSALPTTAVATTTLELGVDIGSVKSVAQIGPPRSLASLRQRLGRSGRRKDTPAILRIYLDVPYVSPDSSPVDRLRPEVVMSVAAINLLLRKFVEPAEEDSSVATVILHQTMSIIAERAGERPDRIYDAICGAGPLSSMTKAEFATMLRYAASADVNLIEQARDGALMLGQQGERIVDSREFYPIFETDEEWRLVAAGRTLGTIPISNAVGIGNIIAFAGRRWIIDTVDDRAKVIEVSPSPAGKVPRFESQSSERMHRELAREMRAVYRAQDVPAYLDDVAKDLLRESRQQYQMLGLERTPFVPAGSDTFVSLWEGTDMVSLVAIAFAMAGFECGAEDLGITVYGCSPADITSAAERLSELPISAVDLADFVENLRKAKYDEYVPDALMKGLWAKRSGSSIEALTTQLQILGNANNSVPGDEAMQEQKS
ncbi:MAG TPA: DEAD/DEAH box helicase [Aurantimonas coralicida]|uniref:DEAD/DEAH box helicase n=2 Tax=root TaxID=1 RepID=A0A9C9TFZ0_9HYPH|nr:DEAD/DEAH box helicase [Aurantimonas coralicida]HET99761.1 DEAD/DEAH box helicase [Aurantimonas coralicida]